LSFKTIAPIAVYHLEISPIQPVGVAISLQTLRVLVSLVSISSSPFEASKASTAGFILIL